MTFSQLRAFATVARLGSLSAAAQALGVSEPAVSAALAALRRDVDDPLFVRVAGGVKLTPGGERLAAAAAEMLGLEDQARRDVANAGGGGALLRVAVSAPVAEYVSSPLLDAFTRRRPGLEVAEEVAEPGDFAALLAVRRADVALGPAPARTPGIDVVPFLRYKLIVVAAPGHRLAGREHVPLSELVGERWLVGPSRDDLARLVGEPSTAGAFVTEAAAQAAAASGQGLMLAIAHTVIEPVRRGTLVRIDVRGTPLDGMWHAATLTEDRRPAEAQALRRFVTAPEATQAIVSRPGGVPAGRFRPAVHVTIWSALDAQKSGAAGRPT